MQGGLRLFIKLKGITNETIAKIKSELTALQSREVDREALSLDSRMALSSLRQCALDNQTNETADMVISAFSPDNTLDPGKAAFALLVDLGIFHKHEDLNLLRLEIRADFPEEVLTEAAGIEEQLAGRFQDRERLSGVRLLAIDDSDTDEVDDAIGVEVTPTGYRVHVVICDVATAIPVGGPIDNEAADRATTVYHPTGRFLMLPHELSTDLLSLKEGSERLVLDHIFSVDNQGQVFDFTVKPRVATLSRRLNYEETDAILSGKPDKDQDVLQNLWRIAEFLFNERIRFGAVHFYPHEVKVMADPATSTVTFKQIDTFSPARRLISEYMVACGGAIGRMLAEQMVPAVYRRQSPPSEPIEWDEESARDARFILDNVRKLKRAEISLKPDRHNALGLMAYTQVTSPLRRYSDLLMQRQLHSFLVRRVPAYSDGDLLARMTVAEQTSIQVKRAINDADRYWAMVALQERIGERVPALLLDTRRRHSLVKLMDYGLTARYLPNRPLDDGIFVNLKVVQVDPRADRLTLID